MEIEIEMRLTRETKGTHLYEAIDPSAPVTTIYLRKSGLGDQRAPEAINVKIEARGARREARVA